MIARAYKRWRHTRGYGVHSPFAYMIVKEVIRPAEGYAYYGYVDIDNAIDDNSLPGTRRMARILLRLAARLGIQDAFLPHDSRTSAFRCALKGACSGMRIVSALSALDSVRLICSTGEHVPLADLEKALRTPGRIVAIRNMPEGWRDRLFDAISEGLMLYGRSNAIFFSRPGMQKVAYSVKI